MDVETRREVDALAAKMRDAFASEVSFLNTVIDALEIALGHRDWETVVQVKSIMHKLADDLATANAKAS